MQFDYRYLGHSSVRGSSRDTVMRFVPDAHREPTFFRGRLRQQQAFREAISALHSVVVSDQRFTPRDNSPYRAWRAAQDQADWLAVAQRQGGLQQEIQGLSSELAELRRFQGERKDFIRARGQYFSWLYRVHADAWFVLDPVITVHPDELSFECFSQDESSYGRLACSHTVFDAVGEFACGTTNIDYSQALYAEFQKIRDYKETALTIDPGGFSVETAGEDVFREVQIELPDTWVRGFLQVSSAMTFPATRLTLHPLDVHAICLVLRRFREKTGPRSMRYCLRPGEPIQIRFDPWGEGRAVVCRRSIYTGPEATEIRVWGRRRLHQLERLIPLARRFTVHLLGGGLPSFYVADLGDMSFTLGLSGWSSSDWSRAGHFDLLAPRAVVDDDSKQRVFSALRRVWQASPEALSQAVGLDRATVLGALQAWTQAGRVMFDLEKRVYRARELSREPLPLAQVRFRSPREEAATRLLEGGAVQSYRARPDGQGGVVIEGTVRGAGSRLDNATIHLDADERLVDGQSSSAFFAHNRLLKGPCEIMLALRMFHSRQSVATPATP